jgi:hypothetical protein
MANNCMGRAAAHPRRRSSILGGCARRRNFKHRFPRDHADIDRAIDGCKIKTTSPHAKTPHAATPGATPPRGVVPVVE